jgi:cytochrome c oxidase subunit 2
MTKMLVLKRVAAVAAVIGALTIGVIGALMAPLLAGGDTARAAFGQATPWQFGLQDSATPVMDDITWFHNYLLVWITAITVFVLVLLVICLVRFNARANPTPSRVTHNTWLEVAWTVVPIFILLFIGVPSFKLLFLELDTPPVDVTVKATGKQWFWSYSYPDNGKFEFDSLLAPDKMPRLLGVDNEMVVPVNKIVRVQTTGADVIHSFAMPAFGIKIDAIPGRLNETWFKATKTGTFHGQCSELCGKDHAFMPIVIRVVSDQEFTAWVTDAQKKFASAPANTYASAAGTAQ